MMSANALNSLAEAQGLYHRNTDARLDRLTEQLQLLVGQSSEVFEAQKQAAEELKAAGTRMERGIDKLVSSVDALRHEMEQQRSEMDKFRALITSQMEQQRSETDKFRSSVSYEADKFRDIINRQLDLLQMALEVANQGSAA